jgi:hypothetical protein
VKTCPPAARAAGIALALTLGARILTGCATLGRATVGTVPSAAAIATVSEGATIGEVLDRLGAPLEYWLAPDGMLLVWRERRFDYDRLGLDPSRGVAFLALDATLGSLLANMKLTLERGQLREARLAVLFDRGGRVVVVAYRDGEGRRVR